MKTCEQRIFEAQAAARIQQMGLMLRFLEQHFETVSKAKDDAQEQIFSLRRQIAAERNQFEK